MAKLDLDAALARRIKAAKKASTQARNFNGNKQVNTVEPAFTVIRKLGGVRTVARYLECSPGTVTRWCTPKTRNGGDGVIPEGWHDALRALAAENLVKLAKNAFTA